MGAELQQVRDATYGERTPPGVLVPASRRNELSFSLAAKKMNGDQQKVAIARTRSPGRRGDRSGNPRRDLVAVRCCFALNLSDVTRF